MGFTITFPHNTGTFVIVNEEGIDYDKPKSLLGHLGTISCYNCVDDRDDDEKFLVVVSGYKDAWCGEYLLSDIRLATDSEITTYKDLMGITE